MSYILQKDNYYCCLDGKHAICKTKNVNLATIFETQSSAHTMLNRTTKKLKGYKIIELETMQQVEDVHKIKRKQFSATKRVKIYNKGKVRYAICGKFVPYDSFTVDHIIPLAKGGTNAIDNLQVACNTCNLIKHDILPEDLMKKLTEIILYQMKKSYDNEIWRKMNYLKHVEQRKRVRKIINKILKQ